ncbi:MAG TPA: tol-pal system protein YbgF [Xanthobacteraceae bacterium]|jgi:tol-pal system protein YbgF
MRRSVQFALLGVALAAGLLGAPATGLAQSSDSDIVVRLDQLQSDMRRLTGQMEQLQYRNQQLEQIVRQLQEERAGAPPRQGAAPPGPPAVPGRRSDAFDPNASPSAPGVPHNLGSEAANRGGGYVAPPAPIPGPPGSAPAQVGAPLDLGTMSANAGNEPQAAPGGGNLPPPPPSNPSATGPQLATLPPSQSPRDEFDLAYGYVRRKDYSLAEQAFRDFLRKYPNDRMASEAQFWLGESLFQNKSYQPAAEAFVAMTKKYPTSPKQPDTLLRLGESLAALKQKDLACVTLAEVAKKFPHAAANVRAAVEREQKRVHC